jgi:hypothetical protein
VKSVIGLLRISAILIQSGEYEMKTGSAERLAISEQLDKEIALVLSVEDLHMIRQWFSSTQDTNGDFLERKDYVLVSKIYDLLGWRIPESITEKI